MITIGFTGTRYGINSAQASNVLKILDWFRPHKVRHGDCKGGDAQFHNLVTAWSNQEHITCVRIVHPPTNDINRAYCEGDVMLSPKPYMERNELIVRGSDLMIVGPRVMYEELRSGTWSAYRFALRQRRPCLVCWPNGYIEHKKDSAFLQGVFG